MPPRSRNTNTRKHASAPISHRNNNNNNNAATTRNNHNTDSDNNDTNDEGDGLDREGRLSQRQLLFSPPTQLPTPLPEEHHPVANANVGGNAATALDLLNFAPSTHAPEAPLALSTLIDFEAHTPPPESQPHPHPHPRRLSPEALLGQRMEASFALTEDEGAPYEAERDVYDNVDEEGDSRDVLRSPPYREARLPSEEEAGESPPPLPVPARYGREQWYVEDQPTTTKSRMGMGNDVVGYSGNGMSGRMGGVDSRSPALPVSPSRRSSNPSSNPNQQMTAHPHLLPRTTVSPSAPRVSKPLSYASFSGSPSASQVAVPTYSNTHGTSASSGVQGQYSGTGGTGRRVQQEYERDYERDDAYYDGYGYPRSPPPPHPATLAHGYHRPQPQSSYQQQHQRSYSQPVHQYSQPQPQYNHRQQYQPTLAHPQPHPASPSPSSGMGGFMGIGSGLAQAIKRGAAGARGVVSGSGAQGGGASGISRGASRADGKGRGAGGQGGKEGMDGHGRGTGKEEVSWARWDWVGSRRVLLIAYPSALQMWDCADLSALRELFNIDLDTPEWGLMLGGEDGSVGTGVGGTRSGGHSGGEKKGKGRVQVVHAAVLPERKLEVVREKDGLRDERPLLGMLLESTDEDERVYEPHSIFVVYSLRTHQVVKMRVLSGLGSTFTANQDFIVIGTISPPNIHILSSTTFHTLHIISSAHLELYSTPPSTSQTTTASALSITNAITNTAQSTSASLGLSIDTNRTAGTSNTSVNNAISEANNANRNDNAPHPVFALSHRLLAYASPSPAYSPLLLATTTSSASNNSTANRRLSSSPSAANTPSSLSSSPFGGIGKIANMTQADMGQAAMKVGESMFSGMKFIGSMALEAAKSRVGGTNGPVGPEGRVSAYGRGVGVDGTSRSPGGGVGLGVGRGPVSRSAPNESGMSEEALRERRYSNMSTLSNWEQQHQASSTASGSPNPHLTTIAPSTRSTAESGHYVTVVDLGPLVGVGSGNSASGSGGGSSTPIPVKIDEFNVSRSQPVADITFAMDGTSVAAVLRDGHVVRVFKLQPTSRVLLAARAAPAVGVDDMEMGLGVRKAAHVYNLYRGRTSAVVEGVEWARDGRWVAVGTRNRTIHVFGTNPYGGTADVRSHMDGRVRNIDAIEPSLTTTHPLVRLRGAKAHAEHANVPLAFTFIFPSDVASAPNLVMSFAPPPVTNSPTFFPPQLKRGTNYQDILVFDPVDCSLSLRRLTTEKQAVKEQGIGASINALGVTSISLPGMGGAGRLSSVPSNKGVAPGKLAMTKAEEPTMELSVTEGMQATWDLRRKKNWVEIKIPIQSNSGPAASKGAITGGDWLAEGEISTCSKSARVLPRSLYLSHQFSFQTLGEDYHALIRRYQFDISGTTIEVRRAVEISAYSSGGGESSFIEGFSSPRDIRRVSSSFDEPIASAISGSFDNSNLPTILPMYPNGGAPGSKPKSFRSSIPIRTMTGIGDGVSEGIGRLRREMHKARSPQLAPRPDSSLAGSVPLEFDEEDEDFLSRDALEVPSYAHGGDSSTSRDASREGTSGESAPSLTTPLDPSTHQLMDADVLGAMEEDLYDGWDNQDKLAVEEAEKFHDVTDLASVEDIEERLQQVAVTPAAPVVNTSAKRKGRAKRRG